MVTEHSALFVVPWIPSGRIRHVCKEEGEREYRDNRKHGKVGQ